MWTNQWKIGRRREGLTSHINSTYYLVWYGQGSVIDTTPLAIVVREGGITLDFLSVHAFLLRPI